MKYIISTTTVQIQISYIFTSFHCTGTHELNKLTSLPMCGFTAQLVKHCTGIMEVTGSNPIEALIFFRPLPSNSLNWKMYCYDHSSLSFTTPTQIGFHIYFTLFAYCYICSKIAKKTAIRVTVQKILELLTETHIINIQPASVIFNRHCKMMTGTSINVYNWVHNVDLIHP